MGGEIKIFELCFGGVLGVKIDDFIKNSILIIRKLGGEIKKKITSL